MTAQVPEEIVYEGMQLRLHCEPALPMSHARLLKRSIAEAAAFGRYFCDSSCSRRYVGRWLVQRGEVFLLEITGLYQLLPGPPLFAEWLNTVLRIPTGRQVTRVHGGFGSKYSTEFFAQVTQGRITKTWNEFNEEPDEDYPASDSARLAAHKDFHMGGLHKIVEQTYEQAKVGQWDQTLALWGNSAVLLNRCSRYRKPGSCWTFLHQAAYFGNVEACKLLISKGASLKALTHDGRSAAEVAGDRGHSDLASLLSKACDSENGAWNAPEDPDVLPSSRQWADAQRTTALTDLYVSYSASLVRIPKGATHYVDAFGRVLIGFHGTFNPPCGMGGESLLRTSL